MGFWAYMLHCRGGAFYVGQTDDLERRIAEHTSGAIPGFTRDHLPVDLVWSEQFSTRDEAKAAERQIKGWSRAKKLALIRGDWARISDLAKNKGSASTSSARTGEGAGRAWGAPEEGRCFDKLSTDGGAIALGCGGVAQRGKG